MTATGGAVLIIRYMAMQLGLGLGLAEWSRFRLCDRFGLRRAAGETVKAARILVHRRLIGACKLRANRGLHGAETFGRPGRIQALRESQVPCLRAAGRSVTANLEDLPWHLPARGTRTWHAVTEHCMGGKHVLACCALAASDRRK
jgi:hypothetical protein